METKKNIVSYISVVVVFILMQECSDGRPTMDSLYGDHVYSGVIYPISGAVPRKIHSPEQTKEMKSQNDTHHGKDSLYEDHVYSGDIDPISGAVPKKIHSHNQDSNIETSTADSNSDFSNAEEMKAQKMKKIYDMMGIDSSRMDIAHKFDGKDSLQPSLCHDTYNDRYGVGKHFVRGARDVGFAIVSGVEDVLDGLLADIPLVPNITSGIGGGLKAILCAIEDGFSDIGSDFDSAIDIAKNGLVDLFKLKGPHPVLGIPAGIGGIAEETVKAAGQVVEDAVGGVKNAVGELLDAL